MDGVDIKIIRTLQRDARANFTDIARNCGVSTDTISKRFKKMKRNGIIRGATLILNPKMFGYDCVASLGIDINHPHVEEVLSMVNRTPGVFFCAPSMGEYDVFAMIILKDIGELARVKESIKAYPLVRDVTVSILVEELKICPQNFELEQT